MVKIWGKYGENMGKIWGKYGENMVKIWGKYEKIWENMGQNGKAKRRN